MAKKKGFAAIFDMASRAVEKMATSPSGMPARIWAELSPWIGVFTQSAGSKWLLSLTEGHSCLVPAKEGGIAFPCTNHAIGPCEACQRPTCIHHAMVDQYGTIVCYPCIAELVVGKRPGAKAPGAPPQPKPFQQGADDRGPPVPEEVAKKRLEEALVVFGLRPGVSWEAIKKQKRKLLALHHPENGKVPSEAVYKRVSAAYLDLERFYRKTEAA